MATGKPIQVFSMMNQPLLELGLAQALANIQNCEYVGNIEAMEQLAQRISSIDPGTRIVIAFDYHMDDESMRRGITDLRASFPELRVLVFLPMLADRGLIVRAMRWTADAYLLHTTTQEALARAVVELARGRSYLESQVTPVVLDEIRRPMRQIAAAHEEMQITERERMLLQLSADGLNNQQIADVLGLAEKTVRNAWSQLFEKISMTDRTQAVMWAIRTGQIELR